MVDEDLEKLSPIATGVRGGLADAAYELLRNAILDGSLAPGTRIVEESLARRIEISRAPLREALSRLKSDGLLVDESARTTRVVSLTPEAIQELHLIRTMLETVACQGAAKRITSADVADLEAIVAEMQRAADTDDRRGIALHDYRFHRRLCETSGLPRLVAMWEQQHVLFRLWLNIVGDTLIDEIDHIAQSHQAILDAVVNGGDDDIFQHVLEHVYFVAGAMRTERRRWASEQPRITSPNADVRPALRPLAAVGDGDQ